MSDVIYNLKYKTGDIFTNFRVLYKLMTEGYYNDKEVYVMSRSVGSVINIVLASTST